MKKDRNNYNGLYKFNNIIQNRFQDFLNEYDNEIKNHVDKLPNHFKLLLLLYTGIDSNLISGGFTFDDDRIYKALENEFRYFGFSLTHSEIEKEFVELYKKGYLIKI